MIRKTTYLILLLSGLFISNACTKRIDIKLEDSNIKLAVEGYLTPEDSANYIRLTETGNYFANEPVPVVSGAWIHASNGKDTVRLFEDSQRKGMYLFPDYFAGNPDDTYTLDIQLADAIGGYTVYQASAEMPADDFQIDSISLKYNENFGFWMILLYAPNPPGRNFYMVRRMTNDLMITDKISEVNIFDDELFSNDYFNGLAVAGISSDSISDGDKITLLISLITEDYYQYIEEVQTELQPHDPMFSGPPANVRSNISNGAVGYFAAYPTSSSSTLVKSP